ncbi:MAG: hypothetical protein D6775_03805 [Caldilineae bacterium]|nr:MAG: hypothetical protein D6775_03805 [Caldilineae bacterium]
MPEQVKALIIGGTAAYGLDLAPFAQVHDTCVLETPYGPSPPIHILRPPGHETPVAFCSRHGPDRLTRSAAFINHRALIWAARLLRAQVIFSWNGVGAIAGHLQVGDLVVPHDFIDFTRTRITSFDRTDLTAAEGPAFHPQARSAIIAAFEPDAAVHNGVYVCTEGPRLETAAEIELYHRAGADIVGMTLSPEVFLAQEIGVPYASLCYITNYATGRARHRPPRRRFGPEVAHTCLPLLLTAARLYRP